MIRHPRPLLAGACALFTCVLPSVASAASEVEQIRRNAEFVKANFGSTSGMADFGCNDRSYAYLDGFITRQREAIQKDSRSMDQFVAIVGSFVGECIVSTYRGAWKLDDGDYAVAVTARQQQHLLQPFERVSRRIQDADQEAGPDSLQGYFRDLPKALGGPPPADAAMTPGAALAAEPTGAR